MQGGEPREPRDGVRQPLHPGAHKVAAALALCKVLSPIPAPREPARGGASHVRVAQDLLARVEGLEGAGPVACEQGEGGQGREGGAAEAPEGGLVAEQLLEVREVQGGPGRDVYEGWAPCRAQEVRVGPRSFLGLKQWKQGKMQGRYVVLLLAVSGRDALAGLQVGIGRLGWLPAERQDQH